MEHDDTTPPQDANAQQQAPSDQPEWVSQLMERLEALEGRQSQLGKDLGRVRSKFKVQAAPAQEPATGDAQQPTVTRDELMAAQRLGQLRAGLGEEAGQHLDARLQDGATFSDVVREAELLAKFAPAPKPAAPKAHGATPAQQSNGGSSFTMAELMEISQKDPARFDRIMNDPNTKVPGMK